MFACCAICYEKYITDDGFLDQERLKESVKRMCKESELTYTGEPSSQLISNPCTCLCHKDGHDVLH